MHCTTVTFIQTIPILIFLKGTVKTEQLSFWLVKSCWILALWFVNLQILSVPVFQRSAILISEHIYYILFPNLLQSSCVTSLRCKSASKMIILKKPKILQSTTCICGDSTCTVCYSSVWLFCQKKSNRVRNFKYGEESFLGEI